MATRSRSSAPRCPTDRGDPATGGAPRPRRLDRLDEAGIAVERVVPHLTEGRRITSEDRRVPAVGGVGDTLLAWVSGAPDGWFLERSTDRGATWDRVELEGFADGLPSQLLGVAGDRALVIGSRDDAALLASDSFLWSSDDGLDWTAGSPPDLPPGTELDLPVLRLADGRFAMSLRPPEDLAQPVALAGEDGGESWQTTECPPEWREERDCWRYTLVSGGLWLRQNAVSLDEGATWQPVVVDPAVTNARFAPTMQVWPAVALPDGGWLGVGSSRCRAGTLSGRGRLALGLRRDAEGDQAPAVGHHQADAGEGRLGPLAGGPGGVADGDDVAEVGVVVDRRAGGDGGRELPADDAGVGVEVVGALDGDDRPGLRGQDEQHRSVRRSRP
jgi:hypothetical protein